MIDSLTTRWSSRNATTWPLALVLLLSLGCLRNVDVDRLKCTMTDGTCPKNYVCVMRDGGEYGSCVAGSADAGPRAETNATVDSQDSARNLQQDSARNLQQDSARGSDGATSDGRGSTDGPSGTADVPVSGGGEDAADVSTDAPAQGSPDVLSLVDLGKVPEKLPNGSPCTLGSECTSKHCVDGLCCDGLCDGQCESCKESGSPGKCVAVKGAPVTPRTACAGSGGCKGLCDGTNGKVCAFPDGTTVCTPSKCAAGMATPASVCDGKGACTQPTSGPCPSGQCASDGSGKCAGSCTSGSCGDALFCNTAGLCVAKKAPGATCTSKDECTTGFCADGVCCESACTGQCQVCDSKGACVRVASGAPRSGHTPCTATDVTCGGTCDGTSDSCVYKGAETVCTAATCSNATTALSSSVCDGKGACTTAQSTNCASSGGYCSVNKCASKQPNGSPCQDNVECTNGNCSGGTCCGAGQTGCNGTCVDLQTSASNCGVCGRTCAGLSCCAGSCVDLTISNTNCGSCGNSCGAQTCMTGVCCASGSTNCAGSCCDSNHTCSGSACTCKGYAPSCGGCEAWGFESNTTEGWIRTPVSVRAAVEKNGIQTITGATGNAAHLGAHGLSMRVQIDGTTANGAYFSVPLCPSGATVTLPTNITFTAWMRFVSDNGKTLPSFSIFNAEIAGPNGSIGGTDATIGGTIPENIWFKFTYKFTDTSSAASHVGFFWAAGSTWSGTIYLDDVLLKL